ncbi:MAG: GIY-YIG nuclease family protein [Candidatus Paceibacterota bacterium]
MKKEDLYKNIPEVPGVYIMKDKKDSILYIGKAVNLKKRVSSYFKRPHDSRIELMVQKIYKIDYKETPSALEALILESDLIKKNLPPFNIKEKDDKSFLWVKITNKETFPRVLLARGTEKEVEGTSRKFSWFGPFTNASDIKSALKIIRKIFPYSTHSEKDVKEPAGLPRRFAPRNDNKKTSSRGCTYYQIGLCPGTCIGSISKEDYKKNIRGIKEILKGKRKGLIKRLQREMKQASDSLEFEKASLIKKKVFALSHIQDVSLISQPEVGALGSKNKKTILRVEGYDISNISGTSSVGSMVVLENDKLNVSQYRKFKINTIKQQDDVGMMKEVLRRRLKHEEWRFPDLILVDGGKGQVNGAREVLEEGGFDWPVIGIAKGKKRKKNEFIGKAPNWVSENNLIKLRDEAHRFAQKYHKELRKKASGL